MHAELLIDEKLLAKALRATGLTQPREVIELALKILLQLHRQADILTLRGKIAWEGDLDAMRRADK